MKKIINAIMEIKRRNQEKKYGYIYQLGYRYFYDIQQPYRSTNSIDIPEFMHEFKRKNLAAYLTTRQMKKIMDSNSLNHCYKAAKKFAKENNILMQGF